MPCDPEEVIQNEYWISLSIWLKFRRNRFDRTKPSELVHRKTRDDSGILVVLNSVVT
jgi:hypothetical protein